VTIDELTTLLARIQVLDNRQVDQLTIQAWEPLMDDVHYLDAVNAVNAHFKESTAYLLPAHIVQRIAAARRAALPATMSEVHTCAFDKHRWLADGTCMLCTERKPDDAE